MERMKKEVGIILIGLVMLIVQIAIALGAEVVLAYGFGSLTIILLSIIYAIWIIKKR